MSDRRSHASYGDAFAAVYDELYAETLEEDTAAAVAFLREIAGDGPFLELGVGTGRVAIPLSDGGAAVHGIDASGPMLARMSAKPGGDRVFVTVGNFADFDLSSRFRAIYVVFNTFFDLLTQEDQLACFRATARHLADDGVFVIQGFVPDVTRWDVHDQRVAVEAIEADRVTLEASTHDPFGQRADFTYLHIEPDGVRLYPMSIRYAYPSELDLMGQMAGLRLRERWSGWDRSPYPSGKWSHVSVWERATNEPG